MSAKIMPIKNPADVLDYDFLFDLWMASGEEIDTADLAVEGPDSALVVDSSSFSTTRVKAWVHGGTPDKDYRVTCRITTSQGRTALRKIVIPVRNE